uniref:Uncharacterized protein n=1 Tax=Leersia perrieri TaxID=77586 RepID=A0A0D9W8R9_9ORYZ
MTQSNIRRERPKRPDPPCTICKGTGKINCRNCFGRGRTNHANLVMLPKGEWPQWCRICGGSGLDYCHRCHGTACRKKILQDLGLLLIGKTSLPRDSVVFESFPLENSTLDDSQPDRCRTRKRGSEAQSRFL